MKEDGRVIEATSAVEKRKPEKKGLVRDTLRRSIAEVKGSNFWVCA